MTRETASPAAELRGQPGQRGARGTHLQGRRRLIPREEDTPQATDLERSWQGVLPAAALQGAVLATVKAAEGGSAQGDRQLTRSSPDG